MAWWDESAVSLMGAEAAALVGGWVLVLEGGRVVVLEGGSVVVLEGGCAVSVLENRSKYRISNNLISFLFPLGFHPSELAA